MLSLTGYYALFSAWLENIPIFYRIVGATAIVGIIPFFIVQALRIYDWIEKRKISKPAFKILYDNGIYSGQGTLPDGDGGFLEGHMCRIAIYNNTVKTIENVSVILSGEVIGRESTARFGRSKTYSCNIDPKVTEDVDIFMVSRKRKTVPRVAGDIIIRVRGKDTNEVTKTLFYDSHSDALLFEK